MCRHKVRVITLEIYRPVHRDKYVYVNINTINTILLLKTTSLFRPGDKSLLEVLYVNYKVQFECGF